MAGKGLERDLELVQNMVAILPLSSPATKMLIAVNITLLIFSREMFKGLEMLLADSGLIVMLEDLNWTWIIAGTE